MSRVHQLSAELDSLKKELSRLAVEHAAASREKGDGATKMLGDFLTDAEQLFAREEENVERFIADRPIASMTAAFVTGLIIGMILRKR